jgi:hypothetical protein
MSFGILGRFGVVSAAVVAVSCGTASAQPVVVVPSGPPVVAVPAYGAGYGFGGTLSVPGLTLSGGIGPRVGGVYVAPVVPPPIIRPAYGYPLYGRPYYAPYHYHHRW